MPEPAGRFLRLARSRSWKIEMMEPNEPLEADEPDIQELISRWAGESKRLLIALPGVLAKLEDLQEDTGRLRERVTDLERENLALRQSREELAETFSKLKALIAGTSIANAVTEIDTPRPRTPPPPPTPEPTMAEPVAPPTPPAPPPRPRASAEPNARVLTREETTPPPTSVRFASVFRPPTKS